MVRSLLVLVLVLTGVSTSGAFAQVVPLTIKPSPAPFGTTMVIKFTNCTGSTIRINDSPLTVADSGNRVVYRPPYPGSETHMLPNWSQYYIWGQDDLQQKQVPSGRYEIRIAHKTMAGQSVTTKAWVTIMDARISTTGVPRPGARVTFSLSSKTSAGASYAFALALSARYGVKLPGGFRIPLDPDGLFLLTASGNFLPCGGFSGKLDGAGGASAWLDIPRWPGLRGVDLHGAYVTYRTSAPSGVLTVSHGVKIPIR